MTYEQKNLFVQADLGIVSRSTTERKKMSTKTTFKRISLVAVVGMIAGLVSVAPANAAATRAAASKVTSLSLATATATPTVGSAVVVNMGSATVAGTPGAGDTVDMTFTGYLSSYPASAYTGTSAVATATGTTTVITGGTNSVAGATLTTISATATALGGNTVAASSTLGNGSFSFTPSKAGTYVLTVWNDADVDGAIDLIEAQQTISITVVDASGYSAGLSTAYISTNAEGANTVPDATTDKVAINAAKAVGTKAGTIFVTLRDSSNALYTGQTVTATVTGSGFVSVGSSAGATGANIDTADGTATTTRTASATAAAGYAAVGIWGDGTAGTGTITISVTDKISLATTVLATKTISWYGTVATLSATVKQGIATVGAANGCAHASNCTQATLALTPAVVIVAKDSNGNVVPGLTVTGTPTDTAVIAATTVVAVTSSADFNGLGYYNASLTGGALANSGKSTTVVYSTTLADGTIIKAAAVTAAVAGAVATVAWSVDKTSYTTGAPVVITVSAKDAAGNAAADGTYANLHAGASTLGGSFTGSTPAASVELVGGKATYTAYAPGTPGTYVVSNKLGTSAPAAVQGTTVSGSVVVTSATDAQIAALISKINALAAIIAKIQKKLGIK